MEGIISNPPENHIRVSESVLFACVSGFFKIKILQIAELMESSITVVLRA